MAIDNRGLLQRAWNFLVYNEQRATTQETATFATLWGDDSVSEIPITLDESLSITAYLRAVRLRADTQASLPFNVIQVDRSDKRKVAKNHEAHRLMNEEFNPIMGSFEGRRAMQTHVDTTGNGFAEIIRNGSGQAEELWLLDPKKVKLFLKERTLVYEVGAEYTSDGKKIRGKEGRIIQADNMFHVKGFSYDGFIGMSPIDMASDVLGIGLASNKFVNRFFHNNAMPSTVISVEQKLDKEKAESLQESWVDRFGGKNQHKPAILGWGAKVMPLTMPLDQAQVVEIARHTVIDICRLMGVPPHLLFEMERETFTNIQTASQGWVRDTIRPNSIEWEQEANKKLIRVSQRKAHTHYTEHDLTSLLRGDTEAMANLYQSLWSVGAINANEIRKDIFNWNNIGEVGDQYMVQQGFAPVDKILKKFDEDIKQTKATTKNIGKESNTNKKDDNNE